MAFFQQMKLAGEFVITIHCFQTNSGHLSKGYWDIERLRTVQDSRCPLELQLGQML